ncbi:hypothetical protein [Paraburkholderia tagetis]|uniref:Uncharacterized protein n=1 Tax=Paraburkholderia tagetis TaxID=2913261 RepID=A0A9X1UGG5_9BURK|nr:hypothetical protein [Paraburkholderia tagetis]MCG5075445.1 hypothetical protein [Paraburkholderia tagetis]
MRADRPYEERTVNHARSYAYAFATVAVFAAVFAGYVLSHRDGRETAPEAQIAQEGVVGTPQAPGPMPSPVAVPMPPPETVSPPSVAAPAQPSVIEPVTPSRRTAASPTETHTETRTESVPRDAASLKSLRNERAVVMKREAGMRADISRNLASARASLDKGNLGPARRSIMAALAEQPGNGDALQMRAELVSREQERDSLLGYARLCARQADWVCAWHNAGHALTIDASSGEARGLLSRAMVEQSAKGERAFDPSLDTQ